LDRDGSSKFVAYYQPQAERRDALLYPNPLHLIERDLITRPVIELRRPRRLVRGDQLGILHRPPVQQVRRDPRRPEGVAGRGGGESGGLGPALHHPHFASMAQSSAKAAGSSSAFIAICGITLLWMVTGPLFHWSDTWQLVINTVTNIVSMLMVFLIQNTQNRESSALQLKVDELLRAVRGAQNAFISLEDLNEDDLNRLKEKYAAIATRARGESDLPSGESQPASGAAPTSEE
jgi:low affinity Fe/Cu permease